MEAMTVVWMAVILKIPIVALLWLVWWAAKEPEPPVVADEGDGGSKRPERPHGPKPPKPPRRGPHDGAPLPSPPRVRTVAAGKHAGAPR